MVTLEEPVTLRELIALEKLITIEELVTLEELIALEELVTLEEPLTLEELIAFEEPVTLEELEESGAGSAGFGCTAVLFSGGLPHPFPPAIGLHAGSCPGTQSVIGGKVVSSLCVS